MREEISFVVTIGVVFLVGLALGSFIEGPEVSFREKTLEENTEPLAPKELSETITKLVAVDDKGNGILTDLSVRAVPGDGKLLVDVDNLLFWVDTQQSIRTAREVAENYLEKNVESVDLTYTIRVEGGNVVGGPSAGAAFTVATIAALENKSLRQDVILTGTMEENGTIGRVGGIIAKGKAAKEGGFGKFLVPEGEKEFVDYRKVENCESIGSLNVCSIDYRAVEVDVEEEIGIEVVEVGSVEDALAYML